MHKITAHSAKTLLITTLISASALMLAGCGGDSNTSAKPAAHPSSGPNSAPPPAAPPAPTLSPMERGAKMFKRCKSCHTLEDGGRHKVGPNLYNIYGANSGSKDGFAYSKAMTGADIIWNDETLDGYIENPRAYIPGNRMSYVGLRKAPDREALFVYLKAQTTPK